MNIDNRQKLLTMVALSAVVILAGDRLVFSPLIRLWKARANQIAELVKDLNQAELLLEREKAIRERWEQMRRQTLPANPSVAENQVLKAVDRWAQESRIGFSSLKPQWRQSGEDYLTLECRADAQGDLRVVTRFLYELERDPLPLKVEDVDISTRDPQGQQLSLGVRFTALLLQGETK
jgi:hypothetical protein